MVNLPGETAELAGATVLALMVAACVASVLVERWEQHRAERRAAQCVHRVTNGNGRAVRLRAGPGREVR